MKKYILLFILVLIISGCKNKDEIKQDKKISSKGELMCVLNIDYKNQNAIYTSYYLFKFNDNGILNGASNVETVEFENASDYIKNKYKEQLLDIVEEYNDIKGIKVKKNLDKNKYSFEVSMDNSNMDDEVKEKFLLDMDRISLYKYYTEQNYTCE